MIMKLKIICDIKVFIQETTEEDTDYQIGNFKKK